MSSPDSVRARRIARDVVLNARKKGPVSFVFCFHGKLTSPAFLQELVNIMSLEPGSLDDKEYRMIIRKAIDEAQAVELPQEGTEVKDDSSAEKKWSRKSTDADGEILSRNSKTVFSSQKHALVKFFPRHIVIFHSDGDEEMAPPFSKMMELDIKEVDDGEKPAPRGETTKSRSARASREEPAAYKNPQITAVAARVAPDGLDIITTVDFSDGTKFEESRCCLGRLHEHHLTSPKLPSMSNSRCAHGQYISVVEVETDMGARVHTRDEFDAEQPTLDFARRLSRMFWESPFEPAAGKVAHDARVGAARVADSPGATGKNEDENEDTKGRKGSRYVDMSTPLYLDQPVQAPGDPPSTPPPFTERYRAGFRGHPDDADDPDIEAEFLTSTPKC
ncbi:hypothetical protein EW146_g2275 [Bondarzewia mesenterica]|uniref:Uncharacterized protein n=1 Tax=Bondarzewia mesenterica TaxID=1095465 RepID=A0A4S4M1D6_9AGAM|nr:hypothetical protein EW146_g2275 [Bondarzewia mesenterica]